MTREQFNKAVNDFEYGIIDSFSIDGSTIKWEKDAETCVEIVDGEVVATGSFSRLLEYFVEEA